MARFLIQSPHKPEECLRALDGIFAKGKDTLEKYEFGCREGDHTGYMTVDAGTKNEVLNKYVPDFLQSKARVVEIQKFTPDEIKAFHLMKAA